MDTIVVGNGIIALTVAFRLAKRAAATDHVTIVGPAARPGSATMAAAAMLNSFAELDAASLDSEIGFQHFELSHLASRRWPGFIKEILAVAGSLLPPGCAKCEGPCGGCFALGTYLINNAAADSLDDENFDAVVSALEKFDEPFERVSPRDIPNYQPEERQRATRAVYIPNEGWINPRLLVEVLEAALSRFPQVSFIEGEVDRFIKPGARIEAAQLTDGRRLGGDRFVLATGATVSGVLDRSELGIEVQRVFYGVGVSLEIRSPEFPHSKCIRTPNRGFVGGLYSVPYFTGPGEPTDHILIGATNFISPVPRPNGRVGSVESLMRAAMEQINSNFYRADLVRVNVGWRPTSQDTLPLVGKTSIDNLIIASGTKRDGLHLSPVLSEKVVAMLYDEPTDPEFRLFDPERKPHKLLTREAAIRKGVRHLMSAAYQHGFAPAKSRMKDQVAAMYRQDLERLHDQVGAIDWGIPPDMFDMYRYGHARG